ncbi:MAG: hypothetical protein N4A45_03975 [Flavobacteriales bacterium]|nr:hypothetical protein [Flavobacteriales bacterium]
MERIRSRYDLSSPPENIKESDRLKEKFSQRYEHYILYQNEFLELLATAEAYYGRELHDTCIKFNGLMNEHNRNLQTFLQQVDHKPKYGTPEHKEYKNLYEIIYLTDSSNEYTKEINNFIQQNFSFLIDEINYK